jgi:hypothetical protein
MLFVGHHDFDVIKSNKSQQQFCGDKKMHLHFNAFPLQANVNQKPIQ